MKQFLSLILAAGMALAFSSVNAAESTSPAPKKQAKKSAKKPAKPAAAAEDEQEPDIKAAAVSEYTCADNKKITVYRNSEDQDHAALRWNKKLLRMKRVKTESGAERLENQKQGLVFIGIPSKAMLFDSKQGHQLANECKTSDQ